MRKAWFCWELAATGPAPVIHYDSLPNVKNFLNPRIIGSPVPLIASYYWDSEGKEIKASFQELATDFPAPVEIEEELG